MLEASLRSYLLYSGTWKLRFFGGYRVCTCKELIELNEGVVVCMFLATLGWVRVRSAVMGRFNLPT